MNTLSRKLVAKTLDRGKRLIVVLNKSDLVPRRVVEEWRNLFVKKGYVTIYISASKHIGILKLREVVKNTSPSLPSIVAVIGYPKVGKSSIINALKGKHSAPTSPYPGSPGYTRIFQLYRVDRNIFIIDTPGILPVEGDPLEKIIRGYPPEKLRDPVNPAILLLNRILKYNPDSITHTYRVDSRNPLEILEEIAKRRGWFYKTSREPLIEEAARTVIRDYHDGRLVFYIRPSQLEHIEGDIP